MGNSWAPKELVGLRIPCACSSFHTSSSKLELRSPWTSFTLWLASAEVGDRQGPRPVGRLLAPNKAGRPKRGLANFVGLQCRPTYANRSGQLVSSSLQLIVGPPQVPDS